MENLFAYSSSKFVSVPSIELINILANLLIIR